MKKNILLDKRGIKTSLGLYEIGNKDLKKNLSSFDIVKSSHSRTTYYKKGFIGILQNTRIFYLVSH